MEITILPQEKSQRLDKYLIEKLPKYSRAFIQRQIKLGFVLVNNKKITSHYQIRNKDLIKIDTKKINKKEVTKVIASEKVKFKIVADKEDYLIINKRAGLIVHPGSGIAEPTLVNGILSKYPEIKNVGEDTNRPGIVHRLDKEASGLILVAKNQKAFKFFKNQFKNRKILKEYICLAHGKIEEDGSINKPIGRSLRKDGKMAVHTQETEKDRQAKTEYGVIKQIKNYTLLRVKIHTGRTHQIRVHLYSIGHPIAGDKLYKIKRIKPADLDRLFLHATKLGFKNLDNSWVEYESNLPVKLKEFVKNL